MDNFKIYEGKVIAIEDVPTKTKGVYNKLIKVVSVDTLVCPGGEKYAYSPSFMPFNTTGSGVISLPLVNSKCLVLFRPDSEYDQILTYMPWEAVGAGGIYFPENPDSGSTVLKVGGSVKTALTIGSSGLISLYSDPEAYLKLEGGRKHIESSSFTTRHTYAAGVTIIDFAENHLKTGASEVGEYKFLFSKNREPMMFSDNDLETEYTNKLGAALVYNDKVIIRAGTIYNYDANIIINKAKAEIGNVYQLETRQNSKVATEKDTVTALRIGYQKKDNLKYDSLTKYPAGTLIEWTAKRVNGIIGVGDYNSFMLRYGKLEDDTIGAQVEKSKGEVFRLQIYDTVVENIGIPLIDPVGAGKGYGYFFKNPKATEQFTLSIGVVTSAEDTHLKDSFYRLHTHSYKGLTAFTTSVYNGLEYSKWFGGKTLDSKENYSQEVFSCMAVGKKTDELLVSYTPEMYSVKSSQFTAGTEMTYEKIEMAADDFNIELKVDETTKYIVKFSEGSMYITLDTGDPTTTTKIELKKAGKIVLNPGSSKNAAGIYLGGNEIGQQLVTKSWVDMIFKLHIHPTTGPGAPTLPPSPYIEPIAGPVATSHLTHITKVE